VFVALTTVMPVALVPIATVIAIVVTLAWLGDQTGARLGDQDGYEQPLHSSYCVSHGISVI
jgi:hypothetical protein